MLENKLSIHIETGNIYCEDFNTNESIYEFTLAQQHNRKRLLDADFYFGGKFQEHIRKYLGGIDAQNYNKYDFLTNKNSKVLFYRYNDLLMMKNIEPIKVRRPKIPEDFIGFIEIQERDWQYLIEKPISRAESTYVEKVYNSLYKSIAENFQEYLTTLELNKFDELNADINTNAWDLMKIEDYDSVFELMKSIDIFYYLIGRFPATDGLLWVADNNKMDFISRKKYL